MSQIDSMLMKSSALKMARCVAPGTADEEAKEAATPRAARQAAGAARAAAGVTGSSKPTPKPKPAAPANTKVTTPSKGPGEVAAAVRAVTPGMGADPSVRKTVGEYMHQTGKMPGMHHAVNWISGRRGAAIGAGLGALGGMINKNEDESALGAAVRGGAQGAAVGGVGGAMAKRMVVNPMLASTARKELGGGRMDSYKGVRSAVRDTMGKNPTIDKDLAAKQTAEGLAKERGFTKKPEPAAQPSPEPAAQPAPEPAAQPAPEPAAQPAAQPQPQHQVTAPNLGHMAMMGGMQLPPIQPHGGGNRNTVTGGAQTQNQTNVQTVNAVPDDTTNFGGKEFRRPHGQRVYG